MVKKIGLILDPTDNVATVLAESKAGEQIFFKGLDGSVLLCEDISFGHKVAASKIEKGQEIIKYGQRIGVASKSISPGQWVHVHNMFSIIDKNFQRRLKV